MMKAKYTLADFPHRDTVSCLDDGAVESIYVPLLTEPDCPEDLMERADMIINDLLENSPEQNYDVNDLFVYVQLWVRALQDGKIVYEIYTGIHDREDHMNLYTHIKLLKTDPVYASFKNYFLRHLIALLFDEKAALTIGGMEDFVLI